MHFLTPLYYSELHYISEQGSHNKIAEKGCRHNFKWPLIDRFTCPINNCMPCKTLILQNDRNIQLFLFSVKKMSIFIRYLRIHAVEAREKIVRNYLISRKRFKGYRLEYLKYLLICWVILSTKYKTNCQTYRWNWNWNCVLMRNITEYTWIYVIASKVIAIVRNWVFIFVNNPDLDKCLFNHVYRNLCLQHWQNI